MSSSNTQVSLDGQESGSELLDTDSICGVDQCMSPSQENMKRAAAKQLVEQFYYQLTEGCGSESCSNENCASSSGFRFKDVSRDKLAIQAFTLSKAKAQLCERSSPVKQSRFPGEGDSIQPSAAVASTSEPGGAGAQIGEGAKSKVPSPTASTSSSDVWLKASSSSSSSIGTEVQFLTEEKILSLIEECKASSSWSKLIRVIGLVFSSPESVSLSFRKATTTTTTPTAASPEAEPSTEPPSHRDSQEQPQEEGTAGGTGAGSSSSDEKSKPVINPSSSENIDSPSFYLETEKSSPEAFPPGVSSSKDCANTTNSECQVSVDIPSVRRTFQSLQAIPEQPFQNALINAIISLSRSLVYSLKCADRLSKDPHFINILVIIMEIPMLHWPEYLDNAYPCMCRVMEELSVGDQARLARVWASYGRDRLEEMVQSLQQLITFKVITNEGRWSQNYQPSDDRAITNATRVLKVLYFSSLLAGTMDSPELIQEEKQLMERESLHEHMQGAFGFEPKESTPPKEDPLGKELGVQVINCQKPLLPYDEFINEPLNESLNIGQDYTNQKFSFVPYSFILTTASKHMSMYYDNRIRMLNERRTAFIQTLVHGGPPNPFLRVRVRRDHLIDDALVNLEMIAMENPSDLRKQLFVEFEGEQGLDEGGVSKEFFQLIVEELFNPDIGMFTYNEESHHFWFNPVSFENDGQFTLIGILLGLAIYNSCILDIHFPAVVYRKLMGKKATFRDLHDMDPTLFHSLEEMLSYEGDDLEDVFCQTFRIGYKDVFGHCHTHDLKDNGDDIPVTQHNKQEFVKLYADYLLNQSIERQFLAFKRGFLMVTSESPLRQMFRPEEIEILVCGSKVFDFNALEQATEYDGGFTEDSPTIKNFWTVVHSMKEEDQRKLLQFTTGTDRVPVGGLSKLKMIIARNGPDSDRLPTSHTCFNVLLLPEYPTVEKMKDRLTKAITYSKGFGML